jgi:AcrR family transcriptional regulator
MARRSTSRLAINTNLPTGRKNTQRERLIAGMVTVANREGYAGASVSAVTSEAKVSKPTFYEYFQDRDDCFLAALADVQDRLLSEVRSALTSVDPQSALTTAVRTLITFASTDPALARFLTNEPLGAGAGALDARDEGISQLAKVIEETLDQAPPEATAPDVPIAAVLGGIHRLLASRLRRSEPATASLLDCLVTWLESYEVPITEHRWRSLKPVGALERSPHLPLTPLRAPEALPPGRPRISEAEVEQNQRLRIMFAAARLAEEKGYAATTINEIAKRARLDLRAFYALFSEKQDAFMAVHELGFQEVMAVTAVAFFAGATWPERSWEAGRAFTQFLEANPTIANVGFVEAYAVGSGAAQRVEDSHVAFTIFLQEGMQHSPEASRPSRVALEAIVTSIFEIVYRQVRSHRAAQLSGLLPNIAHLWLTPFLGPAEANRFIESSIPRKKTSKRRKPSP